MDKLDKFNNTILEMSLNWKYIFYLIAGIYILTTILFIGEGSRWALAIISDAILVLIAIVMIVFFKENKKSPKKPEDKTV